jgi:hypothetical protein
LNLNWRFPLLHHLFYWALSRQSHIGATNGEKQSNNQNPNSQDSTKPVQGSFCTSGGEKDKIPYYHPKRGRDQTEKETHSRHPSLLEILDTLAARFAAEFDTGEMELYTEG